MDDQQSVSPGTTQAEDDVETGPAQQPEPIAAPPTPLWRRPRVQLLAAAAAVAVGIGAWAALGTSGSSTPQASPTQTPSTTSSASNPDADACRVLAAMTWDVSTESAVGTTQDQLNAGLNLLPKGDPLLGAHLLDAEESMVTLDGSIFGVALGNSDAPSQYQDDLTAFEASLRVVETDCGQVGVPLNIQLHSMG